jgi:hypothetical protein
MKQKQIMNNKKLYGGALLSAILFQLVAGFFSIFDTFIQVGVVLLGYWIYKKFLIKKIEPKSNINKAIGIATGTIIIQAVFLIIVCSALGPILGLEMTALLFDIVGIAVVIMPLALNFSIIFISYIISQKVSGK